MRHKNNQTSKDKKSFVLYSDQAQLFSELTDAEAGILIKYIFKYVNDEEVIITNRLLKFVFEPIKQQLERDNAKWQQEKLKRSDAGKKGMLSRWNNNVIQTITNDNNVIQPITKITDSVNVSVNENVNVSESINPTHSQFLDFKYYKTEYETLPMEIQQEIKKRYWDSWQNLNNLIDTEYQNIRKISKQINYTEYLKIKQDYITSNSIKTDTFTKLLSDFNNYKGIENKYDSVYPAICKWIEIENRK
jgi:hypothetical protein